LFLLNKHTNSATNDRIFCSSFTLLDIPVNAVKK
jgi:hypothetical protein